MRHPPQQTTRNMEVLHHIVQSYIESGEPVASRTISRKSRTVLSAATVRNVMADLCDEGYLSQPHTSAGRIPTEKAFRAYVQSLNAGRLLFTELSRMRDEFRGAVTVEDRIGRSSHLLTELTNNVGIAAAIPGLSQALDQVELVSLGDRRVMVVVVTRDRMIRNRVVALDQPVVQSELESIRNYINHNFAGWMLSEVRLELQRRLEQESATYDAILRKLTVLFSQGMLDIDLDPEIHLEGTSNLVGLDLHMTREKMRELFRALEEKKRIVQLLDRFLEQPPGQVAVQVGLGDVHPSMRELALIGIAVEMGGGLRARFAVLGPMRMNYVRVMSAVLHVGQAVQRTSSEE
ncbi:MAG: heat-inducible transcriptional repressor HrcA [Acidobacteria bacterium]|nr:heat-inducible transcriptional repressor HrcA [Acidobacteriota bacterium]